MFVDTHAHIDTADFDDDREAVIERAKAAGVGCIILAGAARTKDDIKRTVLAAQQLDELHATCGVHPHEAAHLDDDLLDALTRWSSASSVVAIGETGLDYHYNLSPPAAQKTAFEKQLDLSRHANLPVVCHIRDAHQDALSILRDHVKDTGGQPSGVIHCFTGGPAEAEAYLDLGFYLSFSGILTFGKSADPIRAAAVLTPDDRLLLETDSPYLAPVPMRGKRNEPAFLPHTAAVLATLRNSPIEEIATRTTLNAETLFRITA